MAAAAYGVGADGSVTRLTPAGSWTFKPPSPAHDVVPQPDGTLLVLANRGEGTVVWLIRPPEDRIADSVLLPRVTKSIRTPTGDRVYFPVDSGLVGVRGRDLQIVPSLKLPKKPRAVVTSPSGDRMYVAADSSNELLVVDRYTGNITTRVTLPSPASALRMDPMGRYVLAHAADGDTAYVISVSTDRLIGEAPTQWRADLPAVAPNGWLARRARQGRRARRRRVARDAARDRWRRGGRLDVHQLERISSARGESGSTRDLRVERPGAARHLRESVLWRHAEPGRHGSQATARRRPRRPRARPRQPPSGTAPGAHAPPPHAAPDSAQKQSGFTVQFAALRAQDAANDVLKDVHVSGATPRLVATTRDGVTIYRVVIGPFPTREDAERIARTSGKSYWVYEGAP